MAAIKIISVCELLVNLADTNDMLQTEKEKNIMNNNKFVFLELRCLFDLMIVELLVPFFKQ